MGSNPVPAWILFRLFHIFICRKINIGPIYTGDGLSIWDEFGQKTVAHLIIRLCINTGEANIYPHVSYRDSPSSDTNHRGYLFKKDDPSVCLYFYADGLSDELPFFAQARPKRMIRLQYKSGYQLWLISLIRIQFIIHTLSFVFFHISIFPSAIRSTVYRHTRFLRADPGFHRIKKGGSIVGPWKAVPLRGSGGILGNSSPRKCDFRRFEAKSWCFEVSFFKPKCHSY